MSVRQAQDLGEEPVEVGAKRYGSSIAHGVQRRSCASGSASRTTWKQRRLPRLESRTDPPTLTTASEVRKVGRRNPQHRRGEAVLSPELDRDAETCFHPQVAHAGAAQLVEHQLPKLRVESSSLFARFNVTRTATDGSL